uniref:DBR1 domain-containing protein n=1 Tax=Syphacia muris TaxID=451379 RepID=A0A158R4U5_9BILA
MNKIYACAAEIEKREGWKFDLLICTGDYQAVRNSGDLPYMHVPAKYRSLQSFHRYYSGEITAPILTLVIGGNHEASGYMQELPYGGWIAPRIYYLGYASVVSFAGLRIAGLSGIYNGLHYDMGHFERPPFTQPGSIVSTYHVRSIDVFRLKQLEKKEDKKNSSIDIMITHDWPSGITEFGDVNALLEVKPHFAEDIKKCSLGNPATMSLLHQLRPRYWLSSHLHCSFPALVPHEVDVDKMDTHFTHFLALDKPIPGRHFMQVLNFDVECETCDLVLKYDPTWLTILKLTDSLTNATEKKNYMPSAYPPSKDRWDFRPSAEEISETIKIFGCDMVIPENFVRTAPPQQVFLKQSVLVIYFNPQTIEFCKRLGIQDLNGILCSQLQEEVGTAYYVFFELALKNEFLNNSFQIVVSET